MASLRPLTNIITVGKPFYLNASNDRLTLGEGWSQPEAGFTWTDGLVANIALLVKSRVAQPELTIVCTPYLGGSIRAQPIMVFANGLLIAGRTLTGGEAKIAGRLAASSDEIDLVIFTPGAKAPKDAGGDAGESRQLGIRVESITLEERVA